MLNKIKDVQWKAVSLEGLTVSNAENFSGFVGLEECFDYDLDSLKKNGIKKKKKRENSRKLDKNSDPVPNKKIKYNNGFLVEECHHAKPSRTVSIEDAGTDHKIVKKNKSGKRREGLPIDESTKLSLDDLMAWSEFQIPEEILRALGEQGFAKPTRIQELTLPAALLGRRDILGAAETGSGKTLAFGIPIIAGIMQLKAKQQAGQDVYDVQYKKSSLKKIVTVPNDSESNISKRNRKNKTQSKKVENGLNKRNSNNSHEANSDGSTDDSDDGGDRENDSDNEDVSDNENEFDEQDAPDYSGENDSDNDDASVNVEEEEDDDSDNSDNYTHLSELYDSDDFKDSSDEEDAKDGSGDAEDDEATQSADETGHEEDGIGCVKVIDDIEMPEKVEVKTGKPLYALILTPTRELAMQVTQHLVAATKYTGIRVATVVGGLAQVKQERILARGPEIVVATPGRLWELVQQGVPHLEQIDHIKFLAIDETDRMVERSHFVELHSLLERVNLEESRRTARQNFVFSATLTMVHELPAHMKGKKVTKRGKILNRKIEKMTPQQKVKKLIALVGMSDPKVVDITDKNKGTAETLTECRIACPIDSKDYYLYYILQRHPGRTIIFCNSIGCVKRLAQLLGILKCKPLPLHASMQQRQRLKNLERFRDDPHGVLVATDVAARGLDIPNVDHVIHYQVPRTAENYVHRSGRTARASKEGLTILMMEPGEAFNYMKLCKTLGKSEDLPSFPVPDQLLLSTKQLVNAARDLDRLELAARKANQETGWLKKAADEMDIIVDEDFVSIKASKNGVSTQALNVKRKQVEAMLTKPLFPKGFSFKYPTLNVGMNFNIAGDQKNALAVMKDALETGSMKKEKRKSKNATLLNLEKQLTAGSKVSKKGFNNKKKNAYDGRKKQINFN